MATLRCPLCHYKNKSSPKQVNLDTNPGRCLQCGDDIHDGNTYILTITKYLDGEIRRNEKFCQPEIEDYCARRITYLERIKEDIVPLFQDKTRDEVITIMARITHG